MAKKSPRSMSAKAVSSKGAVKKAVTKKESSLKADKLNQVTHKINSLKAKKYFPFIFVLLFLIVVFYFAKSLLFAAIVGGKPISRVKLISELEKQAGKQALDSLVTKELLSQEAKKKGVNVSDVDIQSEIQRISDLLKEQGTTLDAALSMQGMDQDDLNENIRLQKTVEKLLEGSIAVSDEDISKYYEDNKSYYGESVKFEDIKDSIKDQIAQEKLSTEYQKLLEKLKSEGNIIYFVDFE